MPVASSITAIMGMARRVAVVMKILHVNGVRERSCLKVEVTNSCSRVYWMIRCTMRERTMLLAYVEV